MSSRSLLLLGAGTMQLPAIEAAKNLGLTVWVVDGDRDAPGVAGADGFAEIDLKESGRIIEFAKGIPDLAGVFTAGTDFSASVAAVAEALGLPGIPLEVALDASKKGRMRRRFEEARVSSPAFTVISSAEPLEPQIETALRRVGVPAVAKPTDNMGARGVRRVRCAREALPAVTGAMSFARGGEVIYEEWIEGREYSVDALVYEGELSVTGIADRHIHFEPYFIEMGHTLPAELDGAGRRELLDCFHRAVRALGITNGAAKGDLFLTSAGSAMVGEIAARLSGGYMSGWTYPLATGVRVTEAGIRLALGEDPRPCLAVTRNHTSAERAFISMPGTVASIDGVERVKEMPGVRELFLRVTEGSVVAPPRNNVEKCGNLIVSAESRGEAEARAAAALRALTVRLLPGSEETDAYLFDPRGEETWYHYPEILHTSLDLGRRASRELYAWADSCARSQLLIVPPALAGRLEGVRISLEGGHHWSGFTPVEALETLRDLDICKVEACEPGVERFLERVLAVGGFQGLVYIRDTLVSGGATRMRRWLAKLKG